MPSGLSPAAQEEWEFLVAELTALGTISTCDRAVLEMAARYAGHYLEANEEIAKNGCLTLPTKTGLKAHPSLRSRDDAARIRKLYLDALGLTPASRSRVAKPEEPRESLEEFLNRKD